MLGNKGERRAGPDRVGLSTMANTLDFILIQRTGSHWRDLSGEVVGFHELFIVKDTLENGLKRESRSREPRSCSSGLGERCRLTW